MTSIQVMSRKKAPVTPTATIRSMTGGFPKGEGGYIELISRRV
ncbi:hypothetical protein HMPREF3034_02660 [Prevotella sp. DNF00663]|nr:hypothetical protein HMPREF3034_02660 [Prevotella sp. DNF00663]